MREEKLSDIIEEQISGEWGEDGDGVAVLRSTNFTNEGRLNLDNVVQRSIDKKKVEKKKLLLGDSIIEKSGGSPDQPVGRVVYFDIEEGTFLCNNFTSILRPKKEVHPRYFFWFLFYNHKIKQTLKYQNKTTGIINLQLARYLEETTIILPAFSDQEKIATTLDKADSLRQTDKQLLKLYDDLARSVFYEMFGDPSKNEKQWEIKSMGEIISNIRYGTGSPPIYSDNGYPFIRATNIKDGMVVKKGMVYISNAEANKIQKCKIKEGDLIIVRSGANTGEAALIPIEYHESYAGYDLIVEVEPPFGHFYNYIINSEYGKKIIKPLSRRAGQPHLNAEQVKELKFIFPPRSLQTKFMESLIFINKQKALISENLESESLFQSLLQRAFKGELKP